MKQDAVVKLVIICCEMKANIRLASCWWRNTNNGEVIGCVKNAVDVGFGAIGAIGGTPGLAISGVYFLGKAAGLDEKMNSDIKSLIRKVLISNPQIYR